MDTGTIVAIVIAAIAIIALIAFSPRLSRKRSVERASLHEHGLADDLLHREAEAERGDSPKVDSHGGRFPRIEPDPATERDHRT